MYELILGLLVGIASGSVLAEESVICPYDELLSNPGHSSYPARLVDLELADSVFAAYVEYSSFYDGNFTLTTGAIEESVQRSISVKNCRLSSSVSVAWENLVPQLSGSLDVATIFPNPVTLLGSVTWTGTRDIVGYLYGDSITVSRTDIFFFQIILETQVEISQETITAYANQVVQHVSTSYETVLASMDNYPVISIATTVAITLDRPFKVDGVNITGFNPVSFLFDSISDVNCVEGELLCRQDITFVSSGFDVTTLGEEGCNMDGYFEFDVHFVCIGISEEACSLTSETEFFTILVDVATENLCADVGVFGDSSASLTSWEEPTFTSPKTGFFSGDVAYFKIHADGTDRTLTGVHVMELVLDMDPSPSKVLVAGGDIVESCVRVVSDADQNHVPTNEASFNLDILTGDGDCFEMTHGAGYDALLTATIQLSYTTFSTLKRKRVADLLQEGTGTVGALSRVFIVASGQKPLGGGDGEINDGAIILPSLFLYWFPSLIFAFL